MAAVSSEQQLRFRWNDHMQHVSKVLILQRLEEQFCDVTLVSEDGFVMKAHQAILASTSAYFQRVLSEVTSDQYPMIVLRGANFREVSCLLDYMYQGNTQVDHSLMERVLEVADMLEVKGLSRIRSNISIKKFMGPAASPDNSNAPSLNMPCTDNPRGSSRSPEEQFYCGNQTDNRTTDTESAEMRLTSNTCEIRSARETPHLPGDGPHITHTQPQPHNSHHEAEPQDDDDVTQTSGIDLSMAKNEPWSPREGEALAAQKEDTDGDESSSKKRKHQQESLCSEETLDPVSDPDWGRIGTKLEERKRHKPRTISLTSITTTDNGPMSWVSDDDENSEEESGDYVRAVTPGPVASQRPFSTPPDLCADKQFPASEPLSSHHSFESFPLPSTSSCEPRVTKYPRSQSCVPFLSVDSTPDNLHAVKPFTRCMPTANPLTTLPINDQSIQDVADVSEEISDKTTCSTAKTLLQTSKTNTSSKNVWYETAAVQESNGYHDILQYVSRNKLQLSNISQDCLTSSAVVKNEIKVSLDSVKTEFSSGPLSTDANSGQSLEETSVDGSVVSDMNDIKHKTQKLKSPKIARNDHTKYVEMQLKKVNVENKLWAKEFLIREQKNTSRLDERENDPEQVEPLCPLEKKIKRPRNMIKRPMNQYMLFQREVREQVRAEYPDESVTQITCRLGYLWRNLPLSEKAKWQARAKYVKQEHMRLHPEYRYNPQLAAERRQEYITELTERRNLYRIKPQSDAEEV